MSKEGMIPKIRIKKFTNELDSKDLKEIADINPKTSLPEEFIYIDLESVEGTQIVSERIEKNSDAPSRAQRLAETGDIFYQTVRPYQKNNVLFNYNSNNYVFSTGYAQIRCFEEINNNFLFTYMQSQKFVNTVLRKCTGTSYPAINSSDLSTIKINFPCFSEQQKIGDLFEKLDQAISLQQQVLETTKEYKQSMLQKMLPKKGEKVPEIRFKGFKKAWDKIKIEKLYKESGSGGTPQSTEKKFYNGNIPFLSIADVTRSNGIIRDTEKKITQLGLDSSAAKIFPSGTISLAMYASVGKVAKLGMNTATSQAFFNMFFESIPTQEYVYQYLKFLELINDWRHLIETGTQSNLNAQIIKNRKIPVPSLEEQQKIGSFFKTLDEKIEQEEKKLEIYKSMKKALVQRMFV